MTQTANESPAPGATTFKARPCPFCDGVDLEIFEEETSYAVVCNGCSAMGPIVENMKDAKKAATVLAIQFWNRRSSNGKGDDLE